MFFATSNLYLIFCCVFRCFGAYFFHHPTCPTKDHRLPGSLKLFPAELQRGSLDEAARGVSVGMAFQLLGWLVELLFRVWAGSNPAAEDKLNQGWVSNGLSTFTKAEFEI